jgi:hypothetical protein
MKYAFVLQAAIGRNIIPDKTWLGHPSYLAGIQQPEIRVLGACWRFKKTTVGRPIVSRLASSLGSQSKESDLCGINKDR